MLFMVIERFRHTDPTPIGDRFKLRGRMMPPELTYIASWIDPHSADQGDVDSADGKGARCFQVMEAPTRESLDPWIRQWQDLVDFEVIPVLTSADFWASRPPLSAHDLRRRTRDPEQTIIPRRSAAK
jgi:hypothetical protein